MTTSDSWQEGAAILAKSYVDAFDIGLVSAKALFGEKEPRTEFLTRHLLPRATARGYLVVYVNLSQDRGRPTVATAEAIYKAIRHRRPKLSGWWRLCDFDFRQPQESVRERVHESQLMEMLDLASDAVSCGDKGRNPILLVIDDAERLTDADHIGFGYAIRAGLDVRKHEIKILFSGTSEENMRLVFGTCASPFYNWAPLEPLEMTRQ